MNSMKDDPMMLLSKPSYKTVVMKMKAPFLNTMFQCCCYTQENQYKLYKWIPNDPKWDVTNGQSGKRFMKIKEKSSLPMRCFIPSSCRGYEGLFQAENTRKIIFTTKKQCAASFLCFARPEIQVYSVNYQKLKENMEEMNALNDFEDQIQKNLEEKQGERQYIGRAKLPFSFCGTSIIIYDEQNQPIYQIYGSSFQCQHCFCPTPSGPCKDAVWVIADYRSTLDDAIGHIFKRWSNCYKICCSTAPWYVIDFPSNSDWKKRLLIISAVQLLDQHYFEKNCQ